MTKENLKRNKLLNTALLLSIITIVYNIAEGAVSVFFGLEDETLALLGFGIDSFVEVISGIGIFYLVLRLKKHGDEHMDDFQKTALKITGTAFFVLTAGLIAGAVINIANEVKPETTVVGIIVSSISILTMYLLIHFKNKVGMALDSAAIISDANCTKTCFYLSILLLISSGLYEIFEIAYIDIAGSLGIAYFALKEGREAFDKVKHNNLSCSCGDKCAT